MISTQNNQSGEKKSENKQMDNKTPIEPLAEKDEVKEAEERTQQAQRDADTKKKREDTQND